MHNEREHAVKVLNSLIETTLDSANGYREAAENASEGQLRTMFAERAARRMELTRQLQQEVRSFGGEPEDDQSLLGKAHNKFVDLKNAILGGRDDTAVIDEVERGEDFIKGKFEAALDDGDLPMEARQVVTRACEQIRLEHDEVSAMKRARH
ncbi:MAG: PA2169 family four-helix-bundle protein [Phenylobacterium sp.]|uniref:PA2169 family four-helix-bundle protein n=1 Tax=Phenylobacterium sp. TaxID=1871053 RepID=UPI001A575D7C|nr:PA2169 family four-helix-bundle protein [Phenylobacterium sp.]MBL8773587.1 PA2169 family four-helix-bundle protein [Phenylobacterium sp.]